MEVATIGLDLAKTFFRFTISLITEKLSSIALYVDPKLSLSLRVLHHVW